MGKPEEVRIMIQTYTTFKEHIISCPINDFRLSDEEYVLHYFEYFYDWDCGHKAMKASKSSDNTKIINLINSIRKTRSEEVSKAAYLKSLGEKTEEIRESYDDRESSSQETLKRIENLIRELLDAQKTHKE